MQRNEFYLTLPSNSSMKYFPDNKITKFTTQLPQHIKLNGDWEVALVEIQYPYSFYTINVHDNNIYYKEKKIETVTQVVLLDGMQIAPKKKNVKINLNKTHITPGNYMDIDEVLQALNENPALNKHVVFKHETTSKHVSVEFKNENITSLQLSPKLSLQLGYGPYTDIYQKPLSCNPSNILLGIPSQLFVYCDVIEPQLVGDVISQLLRIVHVNTQKFVYGMNKMISYSPPHYIPVLRREFQNIEIDIRTVEGHPVPFQFGTLCVKLHFRRR